MFTEQVHHGESEERLDPDYADEDGRTPISGLYVAAPNGDRNAQVLIAAGQGAHVARSLIEDQRQKQGYSGGVGPHYDWLRQPSEFAGEWADRDRWREWFEREIESEDITDETLTTLRERYLDRVYETEVGESEQETRAREGIATMVDVLGHETVLQELNDDAVLDRAAEIERSAHSDPA